MSNESNSNASGGIGAAGLLGVVFVTLKLLGITAVAGWSWWWVTAPFWGSLALAIGILMVIGFVMIFAALWQNYKINARNKAKVKK